MVKLRLQVSRQNSSHCVESTMKRALGGQLSGRQCFSKRVLVKASLEASKTPFAL